MSDEIIRGQYKKVQRAFVDLEGRFAFVRMREGKKWFRITSFEGKIQFEDFEPKSHKCFNFLGACRFHIHNKSLYCGNYSTKALRISGSELDIETIVELMKFRQMKIKQRLEELRNEKGNNPDVISVASQLTKGV